MMLIPVSAAAARTIADSFFAESIEPRVSARPAVGAREDSSIVRRIK
ncbi:MAG TPA: hypothetical protein VKD90_09350 [Gemmataceae bacterium]|nr:hypothetical protein [Gemmataceae bacterium]